VYNYLKENVTFVKNNSVKENIFLPHGALSGAKLMIIIHKVQIKKLHGIPRLSLDGKGDDLMVKPNRILKCLVCIGLITVFLGCAATQKQESTGQYVDDSVITTKVKAAIFDEPTLKSFQINVKTYQGVVQLSGFVDSEQSVKKAGEIAGSVEGVKSVKNDLNVK
jgi:hypothetical protein